MEGHGQRAGAYWQGFCVSRMIAFASWADLTLVALASRTPHLMRLIETLGMIGPQDMFLFVIVLLLLFGAKKLPELARGMGKSLGEFKKAREEYEQDNNRENTDKKS